ncbi:ribonuclease P protein component [Thioclava sp. GXIMD4216]|uniref:ribonuclease P protein component n=1 Tax=Thioclava sp. GXIMD4216 TaxID=3131929 RepID=UPI0030D125CC
MTDPSGQRAGTAPAVSSCVADALTPVAILRKRADFLRAASARRQGMAAGLLQARERAEEPVSPLLARVGFTCSKKVGNSVARNRAKRRLREIARLVLPVHGKPGWDYVLIGRAEATATHDFQAMQDDLIRALARVHAEDYRPPKPRGPKPDIPRGPRRGKGRSASGPSTTGSDG